MSHDPESPHAVLMRERTQFQEAVPPPPPGWPMDVQIVFRAVMRRALDEGMTARQIVADCGLRSHDIYTRFRRHTGRGIRDLIVTLRMRLAKRLLEVSEAPVTQIAYAVGYGSPGGFSATFKRRVGRTPTAYRSGLGKR
jgi:AraC-like DNA-binding protein